jgi:hypothetical protein
MDRAVLDAYGWSDIPTDCDFFLDYEIDEEEWGKRKKPYHYRWPDEVRDEVLARLLELNAQRAAEEARAGAAAQEQRRVKRVKLAEPESTAAATSEDSRRAKERTFKRIVLSAEIIHQLHDEPTFGRVKHQKIFHLCEYIAQLPEIEGEYFRQAAGPLDNKLIKMTEKKLRDLKWYETVEREVIGHAYRPMAKAGDHEKYLERYWAAKVAIIRGLIGKMRKWDTERCEIFSTVYAAWNDMLIVGREITDDAIVNEILQNWHESKERIPGERWHAAIQWMKKEGYVPTGFGRPTMVSKKPASKGKRRPGGTGQLF